MKPLSPGKIWHNAARRLLDLAAAGAGLLLLAPLLAAIAVAIFLFEGKSPLFGQLRLGQGGRPFTIWKFRTMRDGSPGGLQITATGDPRITPIGVKLRKYKLDELPQLFNVLRGDMSLIGPRPEVPRYVDVDDPRWRAALAVRPGITDLATLIYRSEEEMLSKAADPEAFYRGRVLPAKLDLNLRYQASRSWRSDIALLLLSVRYSFLPHGFDPEGIERSLVRRALT